MKKNIGMIILPCLLAISFVCVGSEICENQADSDTIKTTYLEEIIDRNIHASVELCLKTRSDAGFLAAKLTLLTCKNDVNRSLFLKTFMCFCTVSEEYYDELLEIADDVITAPSEPLFTGIAWYRKAQIFLRKSDYKKALIYSEISINFLSKDDYEDTLRWRESYEFLCHNVRKIAYERLGDLQAYEKEVEVIKSLYPWSLHADLN